MRIHADLLVRGKRNQANKTPPLPVTPNELRCLQFLFSEVSDTKVSSSGKIVVITYQGNIPGI